MNNTHDFIQIREGVDLEISSRNFLPYRQIERLGQGCSASVDKVEDTTTGQVFAHKLFRRYDGRNIPKFKKIIHNEVSIIRRLSSHPHIIRLFATYTCGREFGMILTPVADSGDLANYLQTISDSGNPPTAEQFTTLQRAFGCLASSLAFIHRRTIRHKDIKPQNILIHQGCVIYTDFGIALDASESTTTTGRPEAFTRRYCSPEVANWDKRNRKSDVFSLGCVFLEILAVLEPHLDLENSREVAYYEIINDLRSALNHKRTVSSHWSELVRVCVIMLEPNPGRRISADDLLNELNALERAKANSTLKYFCDFCAPPALEGSLREALSSGAPHTGEQHQKMEGQLNGIEHMSSLLHTLKGHSGPVLAVAFLPNDKLVASGSYDKTVGLWDLATGALRHTLKGHSNSVPAVGFSPDGKLVVSGSYDKTVRLWDSATGALCHTVEGHSDSVPAVGFSPDGKLLASGSGDGKVRLWDSATGALHRTLEGHSGSVWSVAFSPDGKLLASGSGDGKVMVWGSATGALQRMLGGYLDSVWSVAFSPDGKLLASGSGDGKVRLWDSATGALQRMLGGYLGSVWSVAFSPDGKLLASGSWDGTVRLWDSAAGTLQHTLEGNSGSVAAVRFSPDGKLLASGSGVRDGTVTLWNLLTQGLERTF